MQLKYVFGAEVIKLREEMVLFLLVIHLHLLVILLIFLG